ncbi:carbohydrate ABC transporter permease [Ruania halotolerans]|uniref:carbohydrate ABC transporter permease n=1 Tax=Ruania halotolerans TaxID=2897773 RepID=UPI001E373369|nr:sugar ABC transporter permease [Ruania halotolerans]UFU06700.1 sugar ABC transporter permease [Ruania halotolerans]UFU06817.1 sugar ABC transporter permease [Ruania halotolerans]
MSAISELSKLGGGRKALTPQERAARRKENGRDNRAGYLFLLPWLVGLFVFTLGPMLASLYLSLTDYALLQPPNFLGLDNWQAMVTDSRLHQSLKVTFIYVFVGVPLQLALALGVAMLLDKGMRGLAFYRSVFYLPSMLGSSVAIALLWRQIFGTTGLVNQILQLLGVEANTGYVSDPDTALWTLILLNVWTFGSPMVIFLAGLRQIPVMYYEASSLDGAGRWRKFTQITMPLLSPIVFFNLVLQIINAFQSFTQAFVVSNGTGGPSDSTLFYTLYLYEQGFTRFNMGYASAMGWLLLLIIATFTAINFFASKYWVFYDD